MQERSFYFAFLVLVFLLGCFDISNSDIWWHLRTGQLIAERMSVPDHDWYSYTNPQAPWIDLHWGFQLIAAGLWKLGGSAALIVHKCLLAVATFALCLSIGQGKLERWQVVVCWLLPAVTIASRLYVRPEVWSFLFLAATLAILFHSQRKPWLAWALPAIQILWVNMQGLFILQWFVVACWLIGAACEALFCTGEQRSGPGWRVRLATALMVPVASFLNPYGMRGVTFPMELFRRVRGPERDFYQQFATEFQGLDDLLRESGWTEIWSGINLLPVLLFVGGLATFVLLATLRRVPVFRVLLFTGFAYLAWQMVRNHALFALVAGVVIRLNLEDLLACRTNRGEATMAVRVSLLRAKRVTAVILLALIVAVPTNILSAAYFPGRRFGLGRAFEQQHRAVRFLRTSGIPPHLYVLHEQLAAICIFHLGPQRRVFADARLELHTKETLQTYLEIERALADDPDAAETLLLEASTLETGEVSGLPALILDNGYLMNIDSYQPKLLDALLHNGRWRCVYFRPDDPRSDVELRNVSDGIAVFLSKPQAEVLRLPPVDTTLLEQVSELMRRMLSQEGDRRGRDAGFPAPPAQIPASGITALGSYLGC